MMRQELLQVKAHLERELGTPLRYLPALLAGGPLGGGPRRLAGHWAHSEAPSQGEPAVQSAGGQRFQMFHALTSDP